VTQTAVFESYVARLLQQTDAGDLSVVWDCGNGAAGPATAAIAEKLSGKHQVLFADIDGHFPNHHPNPVDPATLDILRRAVAESGAAIGIGFDGDGDRIGVIDAKGRQVPGDFLTAYLAQDIMKRRPDAPVILDVKSSDMALDLIKKAGGDPQIWKTGHSHMKKRMAEINAPIAGEMSGHIFIADDFYGFDDALYVATRVISQMVRTGQSITDFVDGLPDQHATPELHIACSDTEKFPLMERLSTFAKSHYDHDHLTLIDGVRVRTVDGWWLVRASNTEAALVVRAEGNSIEALDRLVKNIETALGAAGLNWQAECKT
jgi:phosphomannomutase